MSMKLTELIRKVRNAKTQSQERKIIVTESARIREILSQKNAKNRARQVAKLIYIHTMGYPTHFGQIECITLMSSPSYAEKRIGYLALMTLLDENEEILPLIEHTLKKDMDDPNQFVKALALTTLCNIGSEDLLRDLTSNVEALISSPPYLQKKVLMCAGRICSRCPDLIDNYLPKIGPLIQSPKHGVVISVVCLITEFIKVHNKRHRMRYRKYLPVLIRLLKRCCLHNAALEYDVNGISDPFLIIKLLELLKYLGEGSLRASEEMTDVLAQVSSQVEFGRGGVASRGQVNNTVAAILFQCVDTILGIESERGLKLVAQKILVKFLKYRKYNNLKYVSLASFMQVLKFDPDFVKRYGDVIVDCLKNHDVSIRKRAVELIIKMTDSNNIKFLTGELLNYVQTTTTLSPGKDEEMETLTWDIYLLINKYDPSGQSGNALISWKVNTLIRVLLAAGPNVRKEIATGFLKLVSHSGMEQQGRTVRKLHLALVRIFEKPHLIAKQNTTIQVCIYCVGEYGGLLYSSEKNGAANLESLYSKLVSLIISFYKCGGVTWKTKLYGLTALIKLYGFSESGGLGKCQEIIKEMFEGMAGQGNDHELDVEILYRVQWFLKLIEFDEEDLRQKILEKMPDYDDDDDVSDDEESSSEEEEEDDEEEVEKKKTTKKRPPKEKKKSTVKKETPPPPPEEEEEVSLENLLNFDGGGGFSGGGDEDDDSTKKDSEDTSTPNLLDLLSGPIITTPTKEEDGGGPNLMDLIGTTPLIPDFGPVSPSSQNTDLPHEEMVVYEDEDVKIDFDLQKVNSKITEIIAYFSNKSMGDFENFKFLISVPPYLKRNVEKASSMSLPAISKRGITLKIRIMNNSVNPRKKMVLRFKMEYERKDFGGQKTEKIRTLKNIPHKY